eukprot:scaffold1045_cov186-Alexandrium_tamarense.AAC.6
MRIPSVDEKMFRRMCGDEKRACVFYTRSDVVGDDAAIYVSHRCVLANPQLRLRCRKLEDGSCCLDVAASKEYTTQTIDEGVKLRPTCRFEERKLQQLLNHVGAMLKIGTMHWYTAQLRFGSKQHSLGGVFQSRAAPLSLF